MKKLLNAQVLSMTVLIMACIVACSTSSKPQDSNCDGGSCTIHLDGTTTPENVEVYSEDNWQFAMTGKGWEPLQSPDETIKAIVANDSLRTIVFFAKEPTDQSSAEYILDSLRSFRTAGATIQSAKQVVINDVRFVAVVAQGEDRHIWTWITVQNKFGYVFTCATVQTDAGDADQQRCQDIANSLHIHG